MKRTLRKSVGSLLLVLLLLSSLSAPFALAAEAAPADLPVIKRTISTLKEADVNTFVTLQSCEIPVRKGPFIPVDLRYRNIVNKYPMVLRDASGSIMYLVSNTDCAWARDGKGMPQGSGNISGIIVHERCDNFEWDSQKARESTLLSDYLTDEGYIGKYHELYKF